MPRKLPKACRHPGCRTLTHSTLCPLHAKQHKRDAVNRADVRPDLAAGKSFYHSPAWKTFRRRILTINPMCRCGRQATMVDHIVPITQGGPTMDPSNVQAMCNACHARKRQNESLKARGINVPIDPILVPPWARRL